MIKIILVTILHISDQNLLAMFITKNKIPVKINKILICSAFSEKQYIRIFRQNNVNITDYMKCGETMHALLNNQPINKFKRIYMKIAMYFDNFDNFKNLYDVHGPNIEEVIECGNMRYINYALMGDKKKWDEMPELEEK